MTQHTCCLPDFCLFIDFSEVWVLVQYFSQPIRLQCYISLNQSDCLIHFFLKQKKKIKSIKHTVKNINLFTKKYQNKLFTFYKFYDNFIVIFAF